MQSVRECRCREGVAEEPIAQEAVGELKPEIIRARRIAVKSPQNRSVSLVHVRIFLGVKSCVDEENIRHS